MRTILKGKRNCYQRHENNFEKVNEINKPTSKAKHRLLKSISVPYRQNVFPWRTIHSNISTVFEIHYASRYCSHMKKRNYGKEIFAPSYKEYACVQNWKISLKTWDLIPWNCRKQSPSPEPHLLLTVPAPSYQLADMSKGRETERGAWVGKEWRKGVTGRNKIPKPRLGAKSADSKVNCN